MTLAFKAIDERHVLLEVWIKFNSTSFERVRLTFGLAMLAHLLSHKTVSIRCQRCALAAAFDPAIHTIGLIK